MIGKKQLATAGLVLILALALVVYAAIPGKHIKRTELEVGERASAYWFDFTVNSAQRLEEYEGRKAAGGEVLAVCEITVKNTFGEDLPMGRTDFVLLWSGEAGEERPPREEMEAVYPLEQYCQAQLPEEYTLEKGETRKGVLVYEVPEETAQAALLYEEYYVSGDSGSGYSLGDRYLVRFPF